LTLYIPNRKEPKCVSCHFFFFLPTIYSFWRATFTWHVVNCTEGYGKCCFPLPNKRYLVLFLCFRPSALIWLQSNLSFDLCASFAKDLGFCAVLLPLPGQRGSNRYLLPKRCSDIKPGSVLKRATRIPKETQRFLWHRSKSVPTLFKINKTLVSLFPLINYALYSHSLVFCCIFFFTDSNIAIVLTCAYTTWFSNIWLFNTAMKTHFHSWQVIISQ